MCGWGICLVSAFMCNVSNWLDDYRPGGIVLLPAAAVIHVSAVRWEHVRMVYGTSTLWRVVTCFRTVASMTPGFT